MRWRPSPAGLATRLTLLLVAVAAASDQPPSSLVPAADAATLQLGLEQRVTNECHGVGAGERFSCSAREVPTSGKTSITLRPVRQASLRGRHVARAPVTLTVDSNDTDPSAARALAPGLWRLEWPGYPKQPTFRADAGGALQITLRVKRGRCVPVRGECTLEATAVERQAEIRSL